MSRCISMEGYNNPLLAKSIKLCIGLPCSLGLCIGIGSSVFVQGPDGVSTVLARCSRFQPQLISSEATRS